MHRRAAIVGIGHTDYSFDSGRSEWQLALEAILPALQDAQVEPREVDGIVRYSYDNITQEMLVRSLGIPDLRFYADLPFGGNAAGSVIAVAAAAIAAGQASVVVVFRALNERSGVRYGRADHKLGTRGDALVAPVDSASPLAGPFAGPFGLLSPGQGMAMWIRRYAHEHGVGAADLTRMLGRVAVDQRQYANRNPHAIMRDRPLDMETYGHARMIAEPLRLFDYCLESDGAAAVVLVRRDRARATRDDAAYVLSASQTMFRHAGQGATYARDLAGLVPAGPVDRLYADARLVPEDVSLAQFYDATSALVPLCLEAYLLVPRGHAWRHILEHGIGLDSPVPINTSGGHLSESYLHGMNHVLEAVRQLRGTSSNQVADVSNVLFGINGKSSYILGR